MYLKPLLAIAVSFLLMSCTYLNRPDYEPIRPLPAALAVSCLPLPAPENNSDDAIVIALKQAYDGYGMCAGRYVELLNYLQDSDNGRH